MKIKTSELAGNSLNYAVILSRFPRPFLCLTYLQNIVIKYPYDTSWQLSGPIIETEKITVGFNANNYEVRRQWFAESLNYYATGSTPLIAAMRCYVASQLGKEVEIPEELL